MFFNRILSSILLFVSLAFSQRITIMSYNVDNLFDDVSNGTEYREYDPSRGHWNRDMYLTKLRNIARVIVDSSRRGPDIIALQEVENRNVVDTLNSMYLDGLDYRYIAIVPREGVATNVAVLSRYPIRSVHSYFVGDWDGRPLRDVLETDIDIGGTILYLFNNHWKSKNGGVRKTEVARLRAASVLLNRIRDLVNRDATADIVVVGDLNEDFNEYVRTGGRYRTALISINPRSTPFEYFKDSLLLTDDISLIGGIERRNKENLFYEPWFEYISNTERGELPGRKYNFGSYVYRGRWETPDHILLFPTLFDNRGLFYTSGHFRVVKENFMLTSRGYPLKWYCRGKRCKGFSDHLPILITLYKR